MSRRPHWLQLAKRELLDGAEFIDVIARLEEDGCPSLDAEEIVELASVWFKTHGCPFRFRDPVTGYVTACTRSYRHPGNCGTRDYDLTVFPIHPDARAKSS